MKGTGWSGVPDAVPVLVTVISPPVADEASTPAREPPPPLMVSVAAAPDRAEPSKNEPIRSAAVAAPIPIARGTGFIATIMAPLPVLRPAAIQTRAGSRRFRRVCARSLTGKYGQLSDRRRSGTA